MSTRRLPALWCSLVLVGCAGGEALFEDEELVAETQQGISLDTTTLTVNAMTINAMTINAMTINAMTINAMTINAMTGLDGIDGTSAITTAMADPLTREFMKYVVSCALPRTIKNKFGVSILNKIYISDKFGVAWPFYGDLGLAPEWQYGPCTSSCQERVSSCLLARTNARGVQVRLSLEMHDNDGGSLAGDRSTFERTTYNVLESAVYGNVFKTPAYRKMFAAISQWTGAGYTHERYCDGVYLKDECPVRTLGYAYTSHAMCGDSTSYNHCCDNPPGTEPVDTCYETCTPSSSACPYQAPTTGVYRRPIRIYRANSTRDPVDPDHCTHNEHEVGPYLPTSCSPCAYRVGQVMPSCTTSSSIANEWSQACVDKAAEICGDHDVCAQGAPLVMGDSACIDMVCETRESCCQANGTWDGTCVFAAALLCGACVN